MYRKPKDVEAEKAETDERKNILYLIIGNEFLE